MLKQSKAFASFSVNNIDEAKIFYGQILGLNVIDVSEMPGLLNLDLEGNKILIYGKPNHVPATFTILNFPVDKVNDTVTELRKRGVKMELYNNPEITTDENGILRMDDHVIAWFKDPSGNILSVIENK